MNSVAKVDSLRRSLATVLAGGLVLAILAGFGGRSAEVPVAVVGAAAVDRPSFGPVQPPVAGLVDAPAGKDLGPYLKQTWDWRECGSGTKCAEVLAPLDYQGSSARAVTLALRLKPATKSPKLGSLFINPGGPGGSGKELVTSFKTAGLEQYDIVGWDPRGTGDSTPVRCLSDVELDTFLSLDGSPDTAAERQSLLRANYDFGQACWERNGDLLNHVGTIETVRDLDLLRQLLGDHELNFVGYSYGTRIGAGYAELFGANTGRLVLDAAVNITADDSVIQAQGFDLALGNFATWCAAHSCGLGASRAEVQATIAKLFDDLDAKPLVVGDRKLTESLAVSGVAAVLYSGEPGWEVLSVALQRAIRGEGARLLKAADVLNSRDSAGHFSSRLYAFRAVSCLDATDHGVLDADRIWQVDQRKAPIFGRYFGPDYACALWPAKPSPAADLHPVGARARPLLVIGSTGDNAAPYQFAESMARQLESATLITYEGAGHGSYGGKSACIDEVVVSYLVAGRVPRGAVRCR